MNQKVIGLLLILPVLRPGETAGQTVTSNWVRQNATDTTIVTCGTDLESRIAFPPSSMSIMMPSTMYVQMEKMPLDSLSMPHDSTFLGWFRMMAGVDSVHFAMMNMNGYNMMMPFMMPLMYQFRWDSMMTDARHRYRVPTGMMGWTGTGWVRISGTRISGGLATFSSPRLYPAVAFTGTGGTAGIRSAADNPDDFRIEQNYPNPFNPSTTIRYSIPSTEFVRVGVFNILGHEVRVLVNRMMSAGSYSVDFDAENLPSGVYIYKFDAGPFSEMKRMILIK